MKIFVAGHNGMVGGAITRRLRLSGHQVVTRSHDQLDLTDQAAVRDFFAKGHVDQVYVAAGKVGGILANQQYPADFIRDNLAIALNLVQESFQVGIRRLLYLGSSCIYPRMAPQPMSEDTLLSGYLEPTNEPYAIAKIAGIKLCESYNRQYGKSHGVDYRSVMPTNLYGPGDNYHPENSHVLPALIQRFHDAKVQEQGTVMVWGTGQARREFLYVDDMADACIHVMNLPFEIHAARTSPMNSHINVGTGHDTSIADLVLLVRAVVGYTGEVQFDTGKPDGPPRKLMDVSRLRRTGWRPRMSLIEGLHQAYNDFLNTVPRNREVAHG